MSAAKRKKARKATRRVRRAAREIWQPLTDRALTPR